MGKSLAATKGTKAITPARDPREDAPVVVVDAGLTELQRRFKEVHDRMAPLMVVISARSIGRDSALQVWQDVAGDLWLRLEKGELILDQLTTQYVSRAVQNRTLDSVEKSLPLEPLTQEVEDTVPDIGRWSDPACVNLHEELEKILYQLPPQERLAWLLQRDGYQRKEVARAIGVTEETAKWYLRNANKKVREAFVAAGWDEYEQYLNRKYNTRALPSRTEGQAND